MVGAFGEVQVMDWGLAKVLGEETPAIADALTAERDAAWTQVSPTPASGSHTQAGSLVGTPAFIPPEQAVGEIEQVNERSDVFGLGAVLAVILTGKPPYVGETFESVRVQAVRGKLEDCFARLDGVGRGAGAGGAVQAVPGVRAGGSAGGRGGRWRRRWPGCGRRPMSGRGGRNWSGCGSRGSRRRPWRGRRSKEAAVDWGGGGAGGCGGGDCRLLAVLVVQR